MQSWQIVPLILVAAVFAYTFKMRGKLRGKAEAMHSGAMDALRAEVARQAADGTPIYFQAVERKVLSARIYYVAVTDHRLVIKLAGGDTQTCDRASAQLAIRAKTFADSGNMQTTYSRGWELKLALPDGKHTWRVYDQADGIPEQAKQVQALVAALSI